MCSQYGGCVFACSYSRRNDIKPLFAPPKGHKFRKVDSFWEAVIYMLEEYCKVMAKPTPSKQASRGSSPALTQVEDAAPPLDSSPLVAKSARKRPACRKCGALMKKHDKEACKIVTGMKDVSVKETATPALEAPRTSWACIASIFLMSVVGGYIYARIGSASPI